MKLHKLEVYVFNFEDSQLDDIVMSIEDNRHYCLTVQDEQTVNIKDWSDDHILNKAGTPIETFRSYFGTELK